MRFLFARLSLIILLLLVVGEAGAQVTRTSLATDPRTQARRLAPTQQDDVLWLARCVYSESDRAKEQYYVGWVVRNRVESGYRGNTYRNVVLEPYQFSAFNRTSPRRRHLLGLNLSTASRAWRQALRVALDVYFAPPSRRPFPITTRHFYSPISMPGGRTPHWAKNETSLPSERLGIDPYRFKFYNNIEEEGIEPSTVAERAEQKVSDGWTYVKPRLRTRRPTRLSRRGFSGRVKRPVRPHLDRRTRR